MAGSKEIRTKIKSVQSTRKITKAMEMVSASKMKKAQDRMRASRPYVVRALQIAMHIAKANTEYRHPFLVRREAVEARRRDRRHDRQGTVRRPQHQRAAARPAAAQGLAGEGHRRRLRRDRQQGPRASCSGWARNVIASAVQLGDRPHLDRLVGPVKVLLDKYMAGTIDEVHVYFTTFINTMKQEAAARHACCRFPSSSAPRAQARSSGPTRRPDRGTTSTSPTRKQLLDAMMLRYVEALVFQMVNENMASEQSARMVAMKAASDNAGTIIDELQLIYNKTRQAAITKELAEIVGGAAAV